MAKLATTASVAQSYLHGLDIQGCGFNSQLEGYEVLFSHLILVGPQNVHIVTFGVYISPYINLHTIIFDYIIFTITFDCIIFIIFIIFSTIFDYIIYSIIFDYIIYTIIFDYIIFTI